MGGRGTAQRRRGLFRAERISGIIKTHPDHLRRAAAGRRSVLFGERASRDHGARRGLTRWRRARGWVFASGVDDAESECGLDSYEPWDVIIANDDGADVHEQLAALTKKAADALATQE